MNQLLGNNNVTVTLQWPRESGAVYHINILPQTSYTHLTTSHNTFITNLTVFYNIQYTVSIVSSLCGVTTTKALSYGEYEIVNGYTHNNNIVIAICHTADCGVPLADSNVILDYSSTLEGSVLRLSCCGNGRSTDEQTLNVTCHSSGSWIPDPAQFTCSPFTTVPQGTLYMF